MRPFDFESFFVGFTEAEDSPLEAFSLEDSSLEDFLAVSFLVEAFLAAGFLVGVLLAVESLASACLTVDSLAADFLALPEAFLLFYRSSRRPYGRLSQRPSYQSLFSSHRSNSFLCSSAYSSLKPSTIVPVFSSL